MNGAFMELFSIFIYYQSYLIDMNIEFIKFEIYQFYYVLTIMKCITILKSQYIKQVYFRN